MAYTVELSLNFIQIKPVKGNTRIEWQNSPVNLHTKQSQLIRFS